MNKGVFYAAGAYVLWGLLPLFWKALQTVPALEILAHRMVWSLLVVLALVASRGQWRWLGTALRDRRIVGTFLLTAVLLSINWFLYIWAVNAGHVVEASRTGTSRVQFTLWTRRQHWCIFIVRPILHWNRGSLRYLLEARRLKRR